MTAALNNTRPPRDVPEMSQRPRYRDTVRGRPRDVRAVNFYLFRDEHTCNTRKKRRNNLAKMSSHFAAFGKAPEVVFCGVSNVSEPKQNRQLKYLWGHPCTFIFLFLFESVLFVSASLISFEPRSLGCVTDLFWGWKLSASTKVADACSKGAVARIIFSRHQHFLASWRLLYRILSNVICTSWNKWARC